MTHSTTVARTQKKSTFSLVFGPLKKSVAIEYSRAHVGGAKYFPPSALLALPLWEMEVWNPYWSATRSSPLHGDAVMVDNIEDPYEL